MLKQVFISRQNLHIILDVNLWCETSKCQSALTISKCQSVLTISKCQSALTPVYIGSKPVI